MEMFQKTWNTRTTDKEKSPAKSSATAIIP